MWVWGMLDCRTKHHCKMGHNNSTETSYTGTLILKQSVRRENLGLKTGIKCGDCCKHKPEIPGFLSNMVNAWQTTKIPFSLHMNMVIEERDFQISVIYYTNRLAKHFQFCCLWFACKAVGKSVVICLITLLFCGFDSQEFPFMVTSRLSRENVCVCMCVGRETGQDGHDLSPLSAALIKLCHSWENPTQSQT